MDTTTLTLPRDLMETVDEIARCDGRSPTDVVRTALEIYAERAAPRLRTNGAGPVRDEATRTEVVSAAADGRPWAERRTECYAALGIDASTLPDWIGSVDAGPDDGYDSSNHEEWLAKNWVPD